MHRKSKHCKSLLNFFFILFPCRAILACSGMHYVTRSLSNIYFFSCFVITYVIRSENFCIFLLITIQALLQVRKLCSMTIYLLLISRGILMSWLWQNCYIFNLWLIYCERYNIFLRPLPALMDSSCYQPFVTKDF